MDKRLTYMKYIAVIAVAVVSLFLAIPLSHQSPKQPTYLSFKPVMSKVASKKVAVATPVVQPTTTHQDITPVATPPATPTVTVASYKCEAYSSLFAQYNWNTNVAMAICQAESSGIASQISDPSINYDHISDYGLMQLHGIDILDPAQNIAYAYYHKYLTQGWGAWSTYTSGKYYQYL